MKFLVGERCVACRGDEPTATEDEIKAMMPQIPEWKIVEREGIPQLERTYRFKNFREALDFTNQVGEIAEEEGHHPVLQTEWGRTTVIWYTHKIKGVHRNDFIMAAKTDRLAGQSPRTTAGTTGST